MCLIGERKGGVSIQREREREINILNGVKKVVGCINWRDKVFKKGNVWSYLGQTKKENVSS